MKEIPLNIKHVFFHLGARLSLYESKIYLHDFEVFADVEIIDKMDVDYREIMYKICETVNAFDDEEVVNEAKDYENRIFKIMGTLEPRTTEHKLKGSEIIKILLTKERQEELLNEWKNELHFYLFHLLNIQEVRSDSVKEKTKKKELEEADRLKALTPIEIPPHATFPEIKKLVKYNLPAEEIGVLLYYLREKQLIPYYNDSSLARCSEYLVATGSESLRQMLRAAKGEKVDVKTLTSIKEKLSAVVTDIDKVISRVSKNKK